jgi:hypothetical protein
MSYNNNNKGFDLSKYETVKERKKRFEKDHPNGILLPMQLSDAGQSFNYVLTGAVLFKDKTEMERDPAILKEVADLAKNTTPANAGVIMGTISLLLKADSFGHSLSIAGGPKADKNAWVENAEESAVGRALDNAGYQSGSCSKEEIEKVQHVEQARTDRSQKEMTINNKLMQLSSLGYNAQYVYQLCSQSVRPFQVLSELSFEELDKVEQILDSQMNQKPQAVNA